MDYGGRDLPSTYLSIYYTPAFVDAVMFAHNKGLAKATKVEPLLSDSPGAAFGRGRNVPC